MSRRTPRNPNGAGRRSRLLEPGMHERLVKTTALGVPMNLAAIQCGIALRTFVDWMQRGRNEDERLSEAAIAGHDATADPEEKPYLDLYREVMVARSEAAVRNVGHVQRAAGGGFITEETTRRYRNDDGQWVEETTVKRAAPDWRAAAWYLERSHRNEFGKDAVQVELVGGEAGGAAQVESADFATDLAARISANVAALVPAAQIGAAPELIVDAEVVEDQPAT